MKKINKSRGSILAKAAKKPPYSDYFSKATKLVTHHGTTFSSGSVEKSVKVPPPRKQNDYSSKITKLITHHRTTFSSGPLEKSVRIPPPKNQNTKKPSGLVNLGNSCYMSAAMQCLACLAPLKKFFVREDHQPDINPLSSYEGTMAREFGAALRAMSAVRRSPMSLMALKSKVGEFHHEFMGSRQHDSHEFLMFLLTWLHEDLVGGDLSTLRNSGEFPWLDASKQPTKECSAISLLFEGEYAHTIKCGNCFYKSTSQEPFKILSLSIPVSGECTLTNLMEYSRQDCSIRYCCPGCNKNETSTRKTLINKLPPILIIHLNRFEFDISARKKQNYIDFPLKHLNLMNHTSRNENISYNLCAVLNHYGNMNGGHYTGYCKPGQENLWYDCNDESVTRLTKPVKTSAAYLLFYVNSNLN